MTHAEIKIDRARHKRALEEANRVLDSRYSQRESWDPFVGTVFLTVVTILIMGILAV